ncbi:hypothetical protein K438DRAFT_1946792 [Mycena galopus ATCC 62051]|nr:hypothetical protein K438DRAFT_1946792 [Mycena galopus ATCC 62051]
MYPPGELWTCHKRRIRKWAAARWWDTRAMEAVDSGNSVQLLRGELNGEFAGTELGSTRRDCLVKKLKTAPGPTYTWRLIWAERTRERRNVSFDLSPGYKSRKRPRPPEPDVRHPAAEMRRAAIDRNKDATSQSLSQSQAKLVCCMFQADGRAFCIWRTIRNMSRDRVTVLNNSHKQSLSDSDRDSLELEKAFESPQRDQLPRGTTKNLINGEFWESKTETWIDVWDPALIRENMDTIATAIVLEQGKTLAGAPFLSDSMIPLWTIPLRSSRTTPSSERDPGAPMIIAELCVRAGAAPPGTLNVVHGTVSTVNALCTHPLIRADQALNALLGAACGAPGQRCMTISVGIFVGVAQTFILELVARAEADGASRRQPRPIQFPTKAYLIWHHANANYLPPSPSGPGPIASAADAHSGRENAKAKAKILLDGRDVRAPGYAEGNFVGATIIQIEAGAMGVYT